MIMAKQIRSGHIGILTSGGDTPGLNAAIRGIGKTASMGCSMQVIGFKDGFRGLMENRTVRLDNSMLSGILTMGGTILGTSRDKPHKMPMGGKNVDMTDVIVDAIDRLHSTASSHHRIIIVEIMGHKVGWLALGAGLAGGADAILIPEIPYTIDKLADSILERVARGKRFSIVAVAEGAITVEGDRKIKAVEKKLEGTEGEERSKLKAQLSALDKEYRGSTIQMAEELQVITGLETRVTILGHLQRGGTPSALDRLLATRLGTSAIDYIRNEQFGIMVAVDGEQTKAVPLGDVAGQVNYVPPDHPWVISARNLTTSFGD